MSMYSAKKNAKIDIPEEFSKEIVKIIHRIERSPSVAGVMYFKNDAMVMCTAPQGTEQVLVRKLPPITYAIDKAIKEIDMFDELIAYRICSKKEEISVAVAPNAAAVVIHKGQKVIKRKPPDPKDEKNKLDYNVHKLHKLLNGFIFNNIMKIITNLLKDAQDEKLVKTTAAINKSNPMVDRIMEDDSVEGVIMTNKEGAPILTNVSVTHATLLYGKALQNYGVMARMYMKELDPFDEISVIRINTRKNEIILAPDREFLIIVIQHSRKLKVKEKSKKKL